MIKRTSLVALGVFFAACAKLPVEEPVLPLPRLIPPPILSPFGQRSDGPHYGIDIRVPTGTPVLAAAAGTVFWTGEGEISGKAIIIEHEIDHSTFYFHLSRVNVRKGQIVQRGAPIGLSGRTGNATTPHLHFALCRAQNADCRRKIASGWADPAGAWLDTQFPCFYPGLPNSISNYRLTYPVPCSAVRRAAAHAPADAFKVNIAE